MIDYSGLKKVGLEEHKQLIFGILEKVDEYCIDNSINYCLMYGTLLGAIRHKGFIPWDDDIDIMMSRDDFKRFADGFNRHRTDSLKLISIENTPGYYLLAPKVCDMSTILIEHVKNPVELGVNIDIFIYDYLGDDREKALHLVGRIKKLYNLILPSILVQRKGRIFYKNLILKAGGLLSVIYNRDKVLKKIDHIAQGFSIAKHTKYCGPIASLMDGAKEITETAWWESGNYRMKFETGEFNVPKQYEKILRHYYGDYMKLPPVEERVTHHAFDAYWK